MKHLDPLYFKPEATFSQIVEIMRHKESYFMPSLEDLDFFMNKEGSKGKKWENMYWNRLNVLLSLYPHIFKSALPYKVVLKELRLALEIIEWVKK